jgi:hypothetical protein
MSDLEKNESAREDGKSEDTCRHGTIETSGIEMQKDKEKDEAIALESRDSRLGLQEGC